jgi:hypothetical protein
MRRWAVGLGCLWLGFVAACGGRTSTSSGGEGDDHILDPEADEDPKDPQDPDQGGDFPADTELGACQLGEVSWDVADGCAWIADNRCYETREMACNCACPRDRNSQCTSGFDSGPNGRVQVDCF